MIRRVAIVLIVCAALALPAGVFAWQGSTISRQACQSLNQYRREDKAKWEFILKLAPAPPSGTPERDRYERFVVFLNESDAPKQC